MEDNDKPFDKFNIMIIGDEKVGKTSIVERYFKKKFNDDRKQTIGVECYEKPINLEDKKILIKVWDTAGQEKFAVMAKSYYQRAHGMIITCSIENLKSFENLKTWLNSVKASAEENIQVILVANKCDLEEQRQVTKEEILKKAEEWNIQWFETSSKNNINIDESFDCIIKKVYSALYTKSKSFLLIDDDNPKRDAKSYSSGKCCSK